MDLENTQKEVTGTEPENEITNPPQDALDKEIQEEKKRGEGRIEAEKAAFSLKKNAERAKALGLDPEQILGIKKESAPEKDDDDVPEWYKREQNKRNEKTALELAELIEDERERELVKIKLQTAIERRSILCKWTPCSKQQCKDLHRVKA